MVEYGEDEREQWRAVGWQVVSCICVYLACIAIAFGFRYVCKPKTAESTGSRDHYVSVAMKIKKFTRVLEHDSINLVLLLVDLMFCAFFIVRSYEQKFQSWMMAIEALCVVGLFVVSILEFSGSYTKALYLFSLPSICNIFSIVSVIYTITTSFYIGFGFLRAYTALARMESLHFVNLICSRVVKQSFLVSLNLFAYIYVFACIIFITESLGEIPALRAYESEAWTVYNAIYFIVVTLSTVGYGDFSASTFLGRLIMIVCIIVGILVFASKTSELFTIMKADEMGHTRFFNLDRSNFVILMGTVTPDTIDLALKQLLHPERLEKLGRNCKVIAVVPDDDAFANLQPYVQSIREHGHGNRSLYMFVGNPLERETLARVHAEEADAVYLLGPVESGEEALEEDLRQLFTAVAVRRYVTVKQSLIGKKRAVHIKVLVSRKSHTRLFTHPLLSGSPHADVDVVCFDKVQMNLLASSCFAPGFSTFLLNAVTTVGEVDRDNMKDTDNWLEHYVAGAQNEFYVILPTKRCYKMAFWELYREMMDSPSNVLLLGYVRSNGWVYLAPTERKKKYLKIPDGSYLICMCQTLRQLRPWKSTLRFHVDAADKWIPLRISVLDEGLCEDYDRAKVVISQVFKDVRGALGSIDSDLDSSTHGSSSVGSVRTNAGTYNNRKLTLKGSIELHETALVEKHRGSISFAPLQLSRTLLREDSKLKFDLYGAKTDSEDLTLLSTFTCRPNEVIWALETPSSPRAWPRSNPNMQPMDSSVRQMIRMFSFRSANGRGAVMQITPVVTRNDQIKEYKHAGRPGPSKKDSEKLIEQVQEMRKCEHVANKASKVEFEDGYDNSGLHLCRIKVTTGELEVLDDSRHRLSRHIVIFDPHPENILYLLKPILRRRKVLKEYGPCLIYIVHTIRLSAVCKQLASSIHHMEDVYWICNQVRSRTLFKRIRLHKAKNIIICEQGLSTTRDEMLKDAPAIFLTVRVRDYLDKMQKKGFKHVPVITEVRSENSMAILQFWGDNRKFTHPMTAEGSVVTKKFMQLLLMQSQDNPFLVDVMNAFMLTSSREGEVQVYGVPVRYIENVKRERTSTNGGRIIKWRSLVEYFLLSQSIPISIYRSRREETSDAIRNYVISHPCPDFAVHECDMVTVLSSTVPEDLKRVRKSPPQRPRHEKDHHHHKHKHKHAAASHDHKYRANGSLPIYSRGPTSSIEPLEDLKNESVKMETPYRPEVQADTKHYEGHLGKVTDEVGPPTQGTTLMVAEKDSKEGGAGGSNENTSRTKHVQRNTVNVIESDGTVRSVD